MQKGKFKEWLNNNWGMLTLGSFALALVLSIYASILLKNPYILYFIVVAHFLYDMGLMHKELKR